MERWCKKNFSGDDYRTVYGGEKPKLLLTQLTSPIVRVKIRFSGFKEPKMASSLIAFVPLPGTATKVPPTTSSSTTKKKRPETKAVVIEKPPLEEVPLKYIDLPPKSRRKRIVELMAKHAQGLEAKQTEREESRRKSMEKNHQIQQKVVDDDDLVQLNTTTSWKWMDKTGYLANLSKDDIRELLVPQAEPNEEYIPLEESRSQNKSKRDLQDSFSNRLQALLVDVSCDEDDDTETGNEDDLFFASTRDSANWDSAGGALVDISALTLEERALLHLRSSGLVDDSFPVHTLVEEVDDEDNDVDENSVSGSYEFDDLIGRMKADLLDIDRLNNSRIKFVKHTANAHLTILQQMKHEEESNSQLIAKCNNLMKKQKENKRSARQKVQKKDEGWVPW